MELFDDVFSEQEILQNLFGQTMHNVMGSEIIYRYRYLQLSYHITTATWLAFIKPMKHRLYICICMCLTGVRGLCNVINISYCRSFVSLFSYTYVTASNVRNSYANKKSLIPRWDIGWKTFNLLVFLSRCLFKFWCVW